MTTIAAEAFARLTDLRIRTPDLVIDLAQKRKRRSHIAPRGRLSILAADHPARGAVSVGDDAYRMSDRHDLLRRIIRVLGARNVDGVMASMDVLEELLLLDYIGQKDGAASFLDDRLLIVRANRGGVSGAKWELTDPVTAGTAATCLQFGLDGAKLLWRFDRTSPESVDAMMWCADAIREMNALSLPTFFEPLPVESGEGLRGVRDAEALAHVSGIASALGDSSRNMWLNLPYCKGFSSVARSTTCPILLMSGPSSGRPEGLVAELADALEAGTNVRGAMLGRNVLFPGELDPRAVAEVVGGVVHEGWSRAHALSELENVRPQER